MSFIKLSLLITLCLKVSSIKANGSTDLINNIHAAKETVIDDSRIFDSHKKHKLLSKHLDSSDILYDDYFQSSEELFDGKLYDDSNNGKNKKYLLNGSKNKLLLNQQQNKDEIETLENESIEYENHPGPILDDDTTTVLPIFLIEPQSTYLVKNRPAVLKCKAAHALKLTFKCTGNSKPPPSKYDSHVDPHSGIHMVEVTATISRDLVEEYFGSGPFRCECHGWSSRGNAKSQSAIIEVAYIRKIFPTSPISVQARIGDRVEFICVPPLGMPVPKVAWFKNNIPLVLDNSLHSIITVGPHETLIIHKVQLQDIANYTCVAENIAGKKISDVASLNIYTSIWSPWSEWTSCSEDCIQLRKRKCIINSADNILMGGSTPNEQYQKSLCPGKDFQTIECRGGNCRIGRNDTIWTLYSIMMVILLLSVVLAVAWIRTMRKTRPNYFDGTEYLSETHKKMISFQVNPGHRNYENSDMYKEKENNMVRSVSEHHYDVPNLAINYTTVVDKLNGKYSYDKADSSTTLSDSTYDITSEPSNNSSLQLRDIQKLKSITKLITNYGGLLQLYDKQIFLYVPDFAVGKQVKDKITLSVLNEESIKLGSSTVSLSSTINNRILTYLSPIIQIESNQILDINKPIIFKIFHCMNDHNLWNIYMLYSDDNANNWNEIVQIGKETINSPIYVQLEKNYLYVMTEQLGKYLIVGEPKQLNISASSSLIPPIASKIMKLLIFGQMNPTTDLCSLRIYIVSNFSHVKDQCELLEKTLGGSFISESKSFEFKLNQNDFNIKLNCHGEWNILNSTNQQIIPYNHVLNNNSILHCEFSLQRTNIKYKDIELNINFSQTNGFNDIISEETFTIFIPQLSDICSTASTRIASNKSSTLNSIETKSDKLQICKTIVDINGSNRSNSIAYTDDIIEKLPRNIKKVLCQCLDLPRNDSKDWRLLAKILKFDRYIAYFATKSSPTEQIINLWECKEINDNLSVIYKLTDVLNEINRIDLKDAINKICSNTPLWL